MYADHGVVETIMFRDGHITEASANNAWIAHEGALRGKPGPVYVRLYETYQRAKQAMSM